MNNTTRNDSCGSKGMKYIDPTGEVAYTYDSDRNCYVDAFGNRVSWSDACLFMFENGYFRGKTSLYDDGTSYGRYPAYLVGNANAGEVKTGQDRLNEYIAVAEMLGVNITKGSVNANYAWLTFTYTIPPTNADMANNVLGTTVLQSFKFCFGNNTNNLLSGVSTGWSGLSEYANQVMKGSKIIFQEMQATSNAKNLGLNYTKEIAKIAKWNKNVKGTGWAGTIIIGSVQIGIGYVQDGGIGYNTGRATAGFVGGFGGAALGAWAFGAIGTVIFPGVGTAIGATTGAMIFGYFGGIGGEVVYDGFVK